jgi:tripartite ATP-independent transporter DctM subunit
LREGVFARAERFGVGASGVIATISVLCMLILSILTALDVGLRTWASSPIAGFNEIVEQVLAVAIAGCFSASIAQRRDLILDVMTTFFGERRAHWFRIYGALGLLGGFVLLAWRITVQTVGVAARGETTTIIGMPRGPFMWSITVLLIIACVIQLLVFLSMFERKALDEVAANASEGKPARIWRNIVVFAFFVAATSLGYGVLHEHYAAYLRDHLYLLFALGFIGMWIPVLALVPLGMVMSLTGVAGMAIILGGPQALSAYGSMLSDFLTRMDLAVLPLFILMGSLAAIAGMSDDLYRLAQASLGTRKGGLALATIVGCAGFGAVTGSSVATVMTIGRAAMPEMKKRGYSAELASGSIAAGGCLGILVPPSGAMILYAFLTEVSIGKMFIGALIPAFIAVMFYLSTIKTVVTIDKAAAPQVMPWNGAEFKAALKRCFAVVLLFGSVLGGIYGGLFTVTEAAAVGVGIAFVIAVARGRFNKGTFLAVMREVTATTGMLYVLILGGLVFSQWCQLTEATEAIVTWIQSLHLAPLWVILMILSIYVVLGTAMESWAIMIITVPITAPLIHSLGYDLVWWGIIQVVVIETGLISPPVGINMFAIKSLDPNITMTQVFRGVMPFFLADNVKLVILTLFPWLVTWLPSTMM